MGAGSLEGSEVFIVQLTEIIIEARAEAGAVVGNVMHPGLHPSAQAVLHPYSCDANLGVNS